MDPERWKQVDNLLQQALERSAEERDAFLRNACGHDAALLGEVRSLLDSHRQAGSFLKISATDAVAELLANGEEWSDLSTTVLEPGLMIAHYRLSGKIGQGGMGEVYRARDTKLQRDIALKILPQAVVHDAERMARFKREAQVLASLNHPNIAAIYGLEESNGFHALAMELVEGETLAERLRHQQPLTRPASRDTLSPHAGRGQKFKELQPSQPSPFGRGLGEKFKELQPSPSGRGWSRPAGPGEGSPLATDDALPIARQIAEALEYAHERGVIHRDLKPANVKITPKGTVKVLDFGLAKVLSGTGAPPVHGQDAPDQNSPTLSMTGTEPGMILGTAAYMSPEQARGEPVDSRTDLFSFGAVLYQMATGRPAFDGGTIGVVFAQILKEEPPSPRSLNPELPVKLEKIIARCLEKDRTKRYQSSRELKTDLEALKLQLISDASAALPVSRLLRQPRVAVPALAAVLTLALLGTWFYERSSGIRWAEEQAVPQISSLLKANHSVAAFLLLRRAERYLPGNPQIARIAQDNTRIISVESSPPGAEAEIQDYLTPSGAWFNLGRTPLQNIRIPVGYFRWRISKPGVGVYTGAPVTAAKMSFPLDMIEKAPEGMVPVNGGRWINYIAFLGWVGPYNLPPYYIDRFEITNRQFQNFVDQGGYRKREYWTQKFVRNGRELSWDQAMNLFHDSTDRPGPSTWVGGHYPVGQADYPVSGVSWYEASAYAAFAGKSLPAIFQWYRAAPGEVAAYTVQESNFSFAGAAAVGKFSGLGPYGTYDMAGNVREWCRNEVGNNLRFILGGYWKSPSYLYADPEALTPFDRSSANGFRCVRNVEALPPEVTAARVMYVRDFSKVRPISDAVFRAYRAMYSYDPTPLNARMEGVVEDTSDWRKEKITFDTAYGGERMSAYLFLPKNVRPPYQTIVFFPSARVLDLADSRTLGDMRYIDYVIESGRAVLYPVYQDTYERRKFKGGILVSNFSRDMVIQSFKDLGRSIDYLETRQDIDKNKLGYLGVSMGAAEGVTYAALENRLKVVVLLDGGYFLFPAPTGADQAEFAPRLKDPVLMVNGRYDFTFPLETAQLPLFRMLGTPPAEKRHVVLDTPHDVSAQRPLLVKEVLAWLDKYLGRVN